MRKPTLLPVVVPPARVWDLVDSDSVGRLAPDQFAVAMHITRKQMSRCEGREGLALVLTPEILPPRSMTREKKG